MVAEKVSIKRPESGRSSLAAEVVTRRWRTATFSKGSGWPISACGGPEIAALLRSLAAEEDSEYFAF
jgi:hypothetical protein